MKRPYFFELFLLVNLAIVAFYARHSFPLLGNPVKILGGVLLSMTVQAAVGVILRAIVQRGKYLKVIRTREWLVDTVRLIVAAGLVVFTYGWIKLTVPLYHPRLFDQELWDLDQAIGFGVAPTVFFLDLFGAKAFLRAIDFLYANIFFASTVVASAYFFSHPERRIRVGFANGYAALWITGAWLYLAVPSLGPAYAFKDTWMVHGETLRITQTFQALLMRNYVNLHRAASGEPAPVFIAFGIGAFPSLHVAFQTYVFFWMRRLWTSGQVLFGIFAVAIFLGSMITGWHYLIDGLAGLVLAYACYRFCFPRHADDGGAEDAGGRAGEADR